MKTLKIFSTSWLALLLLVGFAFSSCSDDDKDTRIFKPVEVVAVYVNEEMISLEKFVSDDEHITITLDPGVDLSRLKLKLTTVNGELIDFPTNQERDYTFPMNIKVRSFNDIDRTIKLHVISAPLLVDFYIEGLPLPKENIHFGEKTIIVQVPTGTDLTALKVTMGFSNGQMTGFVNGDIKDYSKDPQNFNIIGVDGTVYPYSLRITDQKVGPASIESVTANNAKSASLSIDNDGNVQVYFKSLTNFATAALTIETGYGNEFVNFTNGTIVNLWNPFKVKIKGMDGIEKEFTFLQPKLQPQVAFSKTPAEMGFGGDGGASLCFSGDYVVTSTHNGTAGIHYYDLTGTKIGSLTLPVGVDWGAVWGLRKIASDDKGAILGVNLAAGGAVGTPYNIYKWNSVTDANPTVLCSFTASALGLTATRTAGINVQGSLDGNAVITVAMTATKVVLKWTIQGGILVSPTPEKINLDNDNNFGNYSSVEQYPGKAATLVGGLTSSDFNGLRSYLSGTRAFSVSGSTSDLRMKTIDGRVYLAHCVFANAKHTFRLCDITANDDASYKYNMLWADAFIPTAANGNATNDADFGYVKGKLYVAYLGTNGGVVCYALE